MNVTVVFQWTPSYPDLPHSGTHFGRIRLVWGRTSRGASTGLRDAGGVNGLRDAGGVNGLRDATSEVANQIGGAGSQRAEAELACAGQQR